jgi:vacuolar-type H+-ATPase subunit H
VLPKVNDDLRVLERLRAAEGEAEKKLAGAEATSKMMLDEAELEGRRLVEAEIEKMRTELEERYVIEEQKVHEEQKRIIADGEEKARNIRVKGEARIDEAIEIMVKKILRGGS